MRSLLHLPVILLVASLAACSTPRVQDTAESTQSAALAPDVAVMADGYELPMSVWQAPGKPHAIVLALHGFNEYRASFAETGRYLASQGVTTYAYDQRGFGATEQRGIWPGSDRLREDAITVSQLLCKRYPEVPLYVLGESMGGAVTLDALQLYPDNCVTGVILVAPAVWGWQTMPAMQRALLNFMAHSFPGYTPTGEGLGIVPSDNREMLVNKWRDPLVIKETRVDSIYGLTNLMESALVASGDLNRPTLILYGEKDEIIPAQATCQMLNLLPPIPPPDWRLVLYPEGYHMLTRDLQAEVVYRDMLAWLADPGAAMPSANEVDPGSPRLQRLCEGSV